MSPEEIFANLIEALRRHPSLTIAVSGGIDSMTLAFVAHRMADGAVTMVHAVSPAVPPLATERVRQYANRENWRLTVVDAGEFGDASYRANPIDRCYYCKTHLYDRIRALSPGIVASGTNLDDLGDFRPGLKAAAERHVVHPFVEAGIGKDGIRSLALWLGLTDIAELPAQPCLASRVETGIAIDPTDLAFIDVVEQAVRSQVAPTATVRCRITQAGVVMEVGGVDQSAFSRIAEVVAPLCADGDRPFAGIKAYRQGSAFLQPSDPPR